MRPFSPQCEICFHQSMILSMQKARRSWNFGPRTPAFVAGGLEAARLISVVADQAARREKHIIEKAQEQGITLKIGEPSLGMYAAVGVLFAQVAEVAMKCVLQLSGSAKDELRRGREDMSSINNGEGPRATSPPPTAPASTHPQQGSPPAGHTPPSVHQP